MSDLPRKSPEPAPEVGPEAPGSRYRTMPEVADLLGMSERAARDWVKRHELPTMAGRPARVAEALVLARMSGEGRTPRNSPEVSPEVFGSRPEAPGSGEPIEATYTTSDSPPAVALVPLAAVADQLQGLADRLADMALEVGQLRERTATQETTIADLRRQLAEAHSAPPAAPPPPSAAPTPSAHTDTPSAHAPAGGFWRRLRRALGGEG